MSCPSQVWALHIMKSEAAGWSMSEAVQSFLHLPVHEALGAAGECCQPERWCLIHVCRLESTSMLANTAISAWWIRLTDASHLKALDIGLMGRARVSGLSAHFCARSEPRGPWGVRLACVLHLLQVLCEGARARTAM